MWFDHVPSPSKSWAGPSTATTSSTAAAANATTPATTAAAYSIPCKLCGGHRAALWRMWETLRYHAEVL